MAWMFFVCLASYMGIDSGRLQQRSKIQYDDDDDGDGDDDGGGPGIHAKYIYIYMEISLYIDK